MDLRGRKKLEELRTNYKQVTGQPFLYFFCPLLFTDEQVALCKGHLVNQAFEQSTEKWTVQRSDVDNFYGRMFEADFLALNHRGSSVGSFIKDPSTMKWMRPEISRGGEKIDYYIPDGPIPNKHSQIVLAWQCHEVKIALKLPPDVISGTQERDWRIAIEKDCRLAALVSVLKTAHLCLFAMLGYRYALSAGGVFLGRSVLGKFMSENYKLPKKEVLRNAMKHFPEYANLVRPIKNPERVENDLINDNVIFICEGVVQWAFLLFVKTGSLIHAVIVPLLESPDAAARFASFLTSKGTEIHIKRCVFQDETFHVTPQTEIVIWPEANFQ